MLDKEFIREQRRCFKKAFSVYTQIVGDWQPEWTFPEQIEEKWDFFYSAKTNSFVPSRYVDVISTPFIFNSKKQCEIFIEKMDEDLYKLYLKEA